MADAEDTPKKQQIGKPFAPGQSGNPAGRPKGARSKICEDFLATLQADFVQHGEDAITKMRDADPGGYVRVVASLLPKELKIETTTDLTDEQLDARIRALANALEIGVAGAADRAPAADGPQPAIDLPAVH